MTLYEILGIKTKDPEKVPEQTITKAYRASVNKYHPDKNPGDLAAEEMFKQVQEAYDILSDPAKRKYYDETGEIPNNAPDPDQETEMIIQNLFWKALSETSHMTQQFLEYRWTTQQQPSTATVILTKMKSDVSDSIQKGEQRIASTLTEIKRLVKLSTEFADLDDKLIFESICGKIESLKRENIEVQDGINSLKKAYDRLKKQNPLVKKQPQPISATTY